MVDFVAGATPGPYARLVQLCDALALPSGFCLLEQRFVDVVLRHGFTAHTLARWRAFLSLRAEFDAAVGSSVYRLLPVVAEHALTWTPPPASLAPPQPSGTAALADAPSDSDQPGQFSAAGSGL